MQGLLYERRDNISFNATYYRQLSADTKMKNCMTKTSLMNSEGPKTKLVLILRFSF